MTETTSTRSFFWEFFRVTFGSGCLVAGIIALASLRLVGNGYYYDDMPFIIYILGLAFAFLAVGLRLLVGITNLLNDPRTRQRANIAAVTITIAGILMILFGFLSLVPTY